MIVTEETNMPEGAGGTYDVLVILREVGEKARDISGPEWVRRLREEFDKAADSSCELSATVCMPTASLVLHMTENGVLTASVSRYEHLHWQPDNVIEAVLGLKAEHPTDNGVRMVQEADPKLSRVDTPGSL